MGVDKNGNPIDPITGEFEDGYYERLVAAKEDELSKLGAGIFGSVTRLRVMAWIERRPDDRFYGALYWEETQESTSAVGTVLPKLAALGLIEREVEFGKAGDAGRCVWYRRLPHPAWRIIHTANEILGDLERDFRESEEVKRKKLSKMIVGDLVRVLAG